MSVSAKDKKTLQEMWNKSETAGQDLPDGTYQFQVASARFHMTEKGKPTFKSKLKVVGGDEEFVGKELEINDNLETAENMGWFKKKLQRLNITITEDFEEVMDGTVADQLKGKIFEGQVKTKNDFMNVYVNRLVGESDVAESVSKESDEVVEKEESESSIEEGTTVTWNGKTGTVIEVLADDNQARVKKEDGSVVRVALNLLSVSEEAEEVVEEEEEEAPKKGAKKKDDEEAEEDSEEEGAFEVPDPDAVEEMKNSDMKKALSELGFEASAIKNPRAVLHAFCTLAHDPKAKIQLEEVSPLAAALEVTVKKGAQFKDTVKVLSEAVQERLG